MNDQPHIAIIILAAGASTRMGRPKQLLPWKETTLLGHAIKTASATKAVDTFVVLGANYETIFERISQYEVTILKNEHWKSGMGTSIACGVTHILTSDQDYDGVLMLLGDQPLISSEYLNELIESFQPGEDQIIATAYSEKKNGVPVIFDRSYFDDLQQLHDDHGARELIKDHASKVVSFKNPKALMDIDTAEDYERLDH